MNSLVSRVSASALLASLALALTVITGCDDETKIENNPTGPGTTGGKVTVGDADGCINRSPEYRWDGGTAKTLTVYEAADSTAIVWQTGPADYPNGIDSPIRHSQEETDKLVKNDPIYKAKVELMDGTVLFSDEFTATGGCN